MADFSALKTSIQNYIKQNGNEEITGNLLQQILLSMVTTLGDSAINDLVTALNAEIANRGNADTTLQGNIDNEATARGNADTELGGRITTLQGVVNGIVANVGNGYVYAGIATPSTTPASGKVFYLALTAGTYTNFGSTVVPQGINILKYNGSAWSLDNFLGLDDAPTQGSGNLVKSGGVLDSIIKDGSAFDLSAYNNGTTYADLSAALTALNALPAAYKKGGMSFKYVQSSDNNYVQYRLKTKSFSIYEFEWEQCATVDVLNQNKSDLDISDETGNVLVRFKEGEIKTKNFDSRDIKTKEIGLEGIDYAVSDENNKLLIEFSGGEVKTKNFDSRNLKIKNTNNSGIDYAVSDEQNNLIVEFSEGHIKTKNFDSRRIIHFGTFSIIGDSYSAFRGYSGPNDNIMWYPNPSSGNNVLEIEQMWFYKFANEYKSALIQNDSYSGSTICYDGYEEGHDAGYADISFCKRIERFTNPCELFLIFGGTNDSWAGSSIGDYKYSDWTEDDKAYFRPALAYLIDYINKHHIGTQIVFILNTGLSSDINTSVETICEHYSVPLLKLSNIDKTEGHPNVSGMTSISEQLSNFLNHF